MADYGNPFSLRGYSIEKVLSDSSTLVFDKNRRLKVIKSLKCSKVLIIEDVKSQLEAFVEWTRNADLVKVEEVFTDVDTIYVVFTYCEGGTLSALIKRAKHYEEMLNESELLDWFIQIVSCLEHFHSRGLAYGLMNPHNILLHNNTCKLSSSKVIFGQFLEILSHCNDVGDSSRCSSAVCDTVEFSPVACQNRSPYLSPKLRSSAGCEQVPTPADDMWALGCILCEMCTRQKTFRKNCTQFSISTISFPEQYSPDLNDIVKRLLEVNPDQRLNAADLLKMDFITRHRQDSQLMTTSPENDSYLIEEYLPKVRNIQKDGSLIASCVVNDGDDDDLGADNELDIESAYLTPEDVCELLASF